jgi:hypothetical protein
MEVYKRYHRYFKISRWETYVGTAKGATACSDYMLTEKLPTSTPASGQQVHNRVPAIGVGAVILMLRWCSCPADALGQVIAVAGRS